jgi:hypothetical protein
MDHHRSAVQSIALISVFLSAVALAGCRTRPRYTDDERPAEINLPRAGVRADLDSFRTQLDGFYRGPIHTHTRRAVCPGTRGCVAQVTIQAVGRSKDINPGIGPRPGRIVAHILNLDPNHTTEMYSLKPSTQAEYYLYIDAAPSGVARWNILEVPTGRSGTVRRDIQDSVVQCPANSEHGAPPYSDVDFARCGEHRYPITYKGAGILGNGAIERLFSTIASRFYTAAPAPSALESTKWYWCDRGCCT